MFNFETKAISGIAYYDPNNGGANPVSTYSFPVGASNAVVTLTPNSWVRLGMSYNTVTREVIWKGPGFYSGVLGAVPPTGTTSPLVLSVYSIQTNHRCKESIYGALATQLKTACNEGTVYFDIPVRYGNVAKTDTSVLTECVAFDIQFATDYTYSFPAN